MTPFERAKMRWQNAFKRIKVINRRAKITTIKIVDEHLDDSLDSDAAQSPTSPPAKTSRKLSHPAKPTIKQQKEMERMKVPEETKKLILKRASTNCL